MRTELTKSDQKRLDVIGRLACVRLLDTGQRLYANILDTVGSSAKPKRARVCHGSLELAGKILHPSQYRFLYWADEEDD